MGGQRGVPAQPFCSFVSVLVTSVTPILFSLDPPGRVCVGGRKGAGGFDDFLKGDHVRT